MLQRSGPDVTIHGVPVNGYVVFASDHPVALHWTAADGVSLAQRAQLHDVSESRLIVAVPRHEQFNPPIIGGHVIARAADAKGTCLALFRGTVKAIESRRIDIQLDTSMDVVQRRAHPRARVPFGFHTAILVSDEQTRYFLAHPLDLGAGGVRMLHRLPLSSGDTFQLVFRPRAGITITVSAEAIESQIVAGSERGRAGPTYVTRAQFIDLTEMHRRFLSRYVGWLLSTSH
jgi:hypothetical protein